MEDKLFSSQHGFVLFNELVKTVFPDAELTHNLHHGLLGSSKSEHSVKLEIGDNVFSVDVNCICWTDKSSITVNARESVKNLAGLIFDSNTETKRKRLRAQRG